MISQRQIIFWLTALGIAVLLVYILHGVLTPFAAGLVLGYLLDPIVTRLQRLGLNRLGATLVMLLLFTIVVVLAFILVLPILAHQLSAFIDRMPDYAVRLQALASNEGGKLTDLLGGEFLKKFGFANAISPDEIQRYIGDFTSQAAKWLGAFATSLVTGGAAVVGLISLFIVTPVVAFYILLDWDHMIKTIDDCLPRDHRATIHQLCNDINTALSGFIRGQSLVCLFLGLWYGIGFSVIGLNFGFLIGVSAGVLSFVPYVGSLTALLLGSAVAIVQGWPDWTLLLLALAVVGSGQFLEGNVLSPKFVGDAVGLHPVWLMFALFAFGSLLGFTGLLIAVPLAATIGVLIRFAVSRYLESPVYRGHSGSHDPAHL
ncbi:AI-2E family transporter [Methylovirgula sp. 4M-Z18]|uniref:AI-2E family transporter n=1 Tax=Methylovirgula sp. 4M-Z18 TaxID=2293567 RepID=UPI000E2FA428|nr:AI-2E family transporter [Methylovirgula sp. 4M-Z18]RFB81058.1 AI-2E family transporter [Methylovirgula sp. 4M-Z18]